MNRKSELRAIEEAVKAGKLRSFPPHMTEKRHVVASKGYGKRMGQLRRGKR